MKKSLLLAGLCAVALGASAQNPFAYDVKLNGIVEGKTTEDVTVTYKLNAPATTLRIAIYNGDTFVKTQEVTEADMLTAGEHSVGLDLEGLEQNVTYRTVISAGGAGVDTPTKVGPTYTFWSPYGIAIDNDTQSKHYGRILVTESQASVNGKSNYWTSNTVEGVGAGIYEFTPTMERVANADGKYGFDGGLGFQHYKYTSGSNMFGPKKVRIAKDGRIFVGTLDALYNQPMYTVDPDDLNSWTPFTVINDADDGTVVNADSNFVAGPSAAFDLVGEGENTKMVNLSCKGGQVFAYGRFKTYEYPIGTATEWNTAVADENEVMPLSMQYTISAQAVTLAYDQDGGIWYAQYRGAPNEAQPSLKHVTKNADGEWEEDYSDISTVVRGGGIAFSPDYKYLAFSTGNNTLKFYEVTKENGNITLNEKFTFNSDAIRGFNDIAFDNAYNCYSCDNGKEVFVQIQLPHPNNNITETPAREEFNFQLGDPTGVKDLNINTVKTRKYVENGQIVIEHNGVKYNTAGQVIK